ncbi:hypothetical protein [Nocardioides sp.]|uniref:hypothetical protein n=1 Tax=Nocardioides sp. TaxID=35761 RepID=UPI00286E2F06|nr:hypothetical protein [Nocardioides sp.]
MPTHVLAGALQGITPILVRHAVVVLLAELSEIDRDLDAFQWVTFEVGVDREQLLCGIPAGVVERPPVPPRVGVKDLLLALGSHRLNAK